MSKGDHGSARRSPIDSKFEESYAKRRFPYVHRFASPANWRIVRRKQAFIDDRCGYRLTQVRWCLSRGKRPCVCTLPPACALCRMSTEWVEFTRLLIPKFGNEHTLSTISSAAFLSRIIGQSCMCILWETAIPLVWLPRSLRSRGTLSTRGIAYFSHSLPNILFFTETTCEWLCDFI